MGRFFFDLPDKIQKYINNLNYLITELERTTTENSIIDGGRKFKKSK